MSVFARVELSLPWAREMYLTDNSPLGYAVLSSPASVKELRDEARLSHFGGWTVRLARTADGGDPGLLEAEEEAVQAIGPTVSVEKVAGMSP